MWARQPADLAAGPAPVDQGAEAPIPGGPEERQHLRGKVGPAVGAAASAGPVEAVEPPA